MRRRFFLTGSWILILLGAAHLAGHVAGAQAGPSSETERQLLAVMRSTVVPGVNRTMLDLNTGFSLAFAFLPAALGSVNLTIAKGLPASSGLWRRLAIANAIWLSAMTIVSLRYWFMAPTSFLVAALIAFLGCLLAKE